MDTLLLIITLSCFTWGVFFHVVGGVNDVGGHDSLAAVMDKKTKPHPCIDEERSALLEFKQGITIIRYDDSTRYHKMDSWKAGGDCCASWDGVECDRVTGRVIGLDLSRSYTSNSCMINGSISGNNTLFQLLHLEKLNLSNTDLEGQIPSSIFHLSNLSSLDLSYSSGLRLHSPNLKDLVHNLTKLEHLHLDYVNMTGSTLLDCFSSYSGLKSIHLSWCGLRGEFPSSHGIFRLPNLRILDLSGNLGLNGHLPKFDGGNSLEELRIGYCSFSGTLASLGRLSNLTCLDLSGNDFRGQMVTTWLPNLTQLVTLDLSHTQLTGQILSSLSSLTKLETLWMQSNHFTGLIPSSIANLTNLQDIDLSSNQFEGAIPNSFSNLSKLQSLDLQSNNLNGTVELDMFHKLGDLSILRLSQNNLSLLVNESTDSVVRDKYRIVVLGSCNLNKFPAFLLNQSKLEWLDLSENNMHGIVPTRIWNHSLSLAFMNVSHNFLTTIEDYPIMLSGSTLRTLDISLNVLEGSLPFPPLSATIYLASNNRLSGQLSPLFCNFSDLYIFDVSSNYVNGTIPECPDTFGRSLLMLNLQNNKLHGTIPQSWTSGRNLEMIALSQNQLQGKIPRSLANCIMLEFIDFGNNQIVDTFPSWLGDLQELKVLLLQSNRFHGEIQKVEGNVQFSQLRIIDLSFNGFSGNLPPMYFQSWKSMEPLDAEKRIEYMKTDLSGGWSYGYYEYSMKITNKGMEMVYEKVLNVFKAIDFSHNHFGGEIPASIATLKGLHLLNLGHNNFTGAIPSWLGDLRQLESLDLSHNKLTGRIPQTLRQLTFLEFFNVSYNNLSGIKPRGGQFDTFENSSFEGNPRLLADAQIEPPIPKTKEEDDGDEQVFDETEWTVVLIGCGSGLVVGVILGNEFVVRKPKWFVKLFGRWL